MVAHVLRLRLILLLGAVRGARALRSIAAFVATVAVTVVVCSAVLSLGNVSETVAAAVVVLGSAATMLAFLVVPALFASVDQLDPRRFAPFGVDEKRLPWVLALASLVSVPSLALLAVAVCVAVVVVGFGVPWILAVLGCTTMIVVTALMARIGMALSAILLPERRSRELTVLFTIPVIVIAFPVAVYSASLSWNGQVPQAVMTATGVIGATPLAAPYGTLFALAAGDIGGVWLRAAIAVATVAGVLALWIFLARHMLTTTERPVTTRERSGLGWFALLPSTPLGGVAARSLVYWIRDRRYVVNVLVVPIAGVLTVLPLLVAGVPLEVAALVPVPVMALFFGWLPHNDVAYDSTAVWIHIASGLRGVPDRVGRLVPVSLIALPVLAVATSITLAAVGNWHLLMPLSGLAAALLFSGLGLSSVSSVLAPYAVSRPGDSPFQQPQRSSSSPTYGPALAFLGAIVVSAPVLWLFVVTVMEGDRHAAATFWLGLAIGVLVLVGGVVLGGRIFESSGERLMEFVETT